MKSILKCKLTIDHDKLLEYAKKKEFDIKNYEVNSYHRDTTEEFKNLIIKETKEAVKEGIAQVEFKNELQEQK